MNVAFSADIAVNKLTQSNRFSVLSSLIMINLDR